MMRKLIHATLVLTLLLNFNASNAENGNAFSSPEKSLDRNSNYVYFKTVSIIPQELNNSLSGIINQSPAEIINGGLIRVIQFDILPDDNQKKLLENEGIKLIDYVPNRAFISFIPKNITFAKLKALKISRIAEFSGDLKTDNFIYENDFPEYVIQGNKIRIQAIGFSFADFTSIVQNLESNYNAQILNSDENLSQIEFLIDQSKVNDLKKINELKYIEIGSEEGSPENYTGRTLHRSNTLNTSYAGGKKYDGSGIVVMMQDDGDIGPHIDFKGRVDQSSANINSSLGNHGDHVAGIFMGAGNLDPLAEGMAPGVFGYIYGNSNTHYNAVPARYLNNNLVLTTKSYSNGCNAGYTTLTNQLDQQIITYPNLLHVFSAGNSNGSNCGYGAGNQWGNVTGGHKIGKNVIAVANLDYIDQIAGSSSRGPASDGRIKPDVSSKGSNVYSDDENYSYRTISGTSMACPGVTGTVAQLYQAYKALNGNVDPNSALIKAIVLNSADDIGNPGPDFIHGWGRINANNAIKVLENQYYMDSSISAFSSNLTHNLNIPSGVAQVKIMLYWKDPAASANSLFHLVNDLDFKVITPSSAILNPLVLNPTPNSSILNLPATPGIDNLNNMEQVVINAPAAGNYQLQVQGISIPQGPQAYYIVYSYLYDDVELTYPIGGESIVPGETETIRWDALGNSALFTLEYSIDSGSNWVLIDNNIPGNQRYYNWSIPAIISGKAMLKISRGPSQSTSHSTFSLIGVPGNLNTVWSCADSLLLGWDAVSGADSYEISQLGTQYMDSIGTSSTNFFTVKNISSSNEYWFSVKAINSNEGIIGRRAYALRKTPGVFSCPVPHDIAVTSINSPSNSQIPFCQNLDSIPISVTIENKGSTSESNFQVKILLNNGNILSYQYTDTLELYQSDEVFFNGYADLTGGNTHIFKAWTDLITDGNRANDSIQSITTIYSSNLKNLPYNQSFDLFSLCPVATNCGGTVCAMSDDWFNLPNNFNDDIDWRTNTGGTTSGGTGPSSDHTSGNGNYLYLEASGNPVCSDKTAVLVSPCLNLAYAQLPELSFWYHMLGTAMGELHVDILADGKWDIDVLSPIVGNQGSLWIQRLVDLGAYSGKIINVRFRGITGSDFTSDIAIDDVSVKDNFLYAFDAALTNVISPSFSSKEDCLLSDSIEVTVRIENLGANSIGNIPMKYSLNSGVPVSEVFNGILNPNSVDTFTFNTKLNFPGQGNYDLKIWNDLGSDLNPGNDTLFKSIDITPGNLFGVPFVQNFDAMTLCPTTTNCGATNCNLTQGWNNWENGSEDDIDWRVNNGSTASANTGPTNDQNTGNSSGKYLYLEVSNNCNNQTAIIQSPCLDFTNLINPQLSLYYHMYGADMGELHFDVLLGDQWYNDFVSPIIGDQGNSWQQWNIDLSLFSGSIATFRIRGISAVGFAGDMAIDNINIQENYTSAQANFTFSQPTCSGQTITFTDISTGAALNYLWDFGSSATPSNAVGQGPHTVYFATSGVGDIELIAYNINSSDTMVKTLILDTLPSTNFSWVGNDSIFFINQSSNASSFNWDFGDGNSSNSLQPVHVYASPGIYTVTLTTSNGCGSSSVTKVINVGVSSIYTKGENHVIAYPNPNSGILNIKTDMFKKYGNSNISVMDIRGVEVYRKAILSSNEEVQINIGHLSPGIYILKIENNESNVIMKIEKE